MALAMLMLTPAMFATAGEPPKAAAAPAKVREANTVLLRSVLGVGWDQYKASFVTPEGRVIDDGNGGISHSEGQGYGMLLAVRSGDRAAFDRIWQWTERELMIREDGLAVWSWDPSATPHIKDQNNASDGDLLIAWALAEAATRWNRPELRDRAKELALALNKAAVRTGPYGTILLPAAQGFTEADQPDGPIVNLSYWVFPAFDRLKSIAPEVDWDGLKRSGLDLLQKARFGPLRMTSDWVALGGEAPAPAKNFKPEFSYNAIRIPLYLAWSDVDRESALPRYGRLWNEKENLGPFIIDVSNGEAKGELGGRGFKAISSLAHCAETGRAMPLESIQPAKDLYYPSTLLLMVTAVLLERYPQCV